jgi:hypothetical protein
MLKTLSASHFFGNVECKMERGIIVFFKYVPSVRIEDLAVDLGVEVPPEGVLAPRRGYPYAETRR